MKKKILIAALCVLFLASLLPPAASADNPLSFIAINDTMPPDLINAAVYYGGTVYVPYWLFTNYSFGIGYSYFSSSSTAYLYNTKNQIFFELPSGKTYSTDDVQYSAPAILWGGTVYLPLGFLCSAFGGFTYRNIGGNEYGSILRITTGNETLGDEEFFRAAASAMKRYYQTYNVSVDTPEPSHTPAAPEPTPNPQPREGDAVRLGLEGIPTPEVLDLLKQNGVMPSFFLNAEEIRNDPDMVRRLACAGYTVGVSCPGGTEEELREASSLLWETARLRTILCTMPEGAVTPDGAVVFTGTQPDMTADERRERIYDVTSELEMRSGDQTMIFPTGDAEITALKMLLYYFHDQGFTVAPLREPDGGTTPIVA